MQFSAEISCRSEMIILIRKSAKFSVVKPARRHKGLTSDFSSHSQVLSQVPVFVSIMSRAADNCHLSFRLFLGKKLRQAIKVFFWGKNMIIAK